MTGEGTFRPPDGRVRAGLPVDGQSPHRLEGIDVPRRREPNAPRRGRRGRRALRDIVRRDARTPSPGQAGEKPSQLEEGATVRGPPALLRIAAHQPEAPSDRGSRREAWPPGPGRLLRCGDGCGGANRPEILNRLRRASCGLRRGEVQLAGDLSRFRCQTTVAPTKKGELVERQRRGGASGQAKRVAFLRTGARAAVAVRRLE